MMATRPHFLRGVRALGLLAAFAVAAAAAAEEESAKTSTAINSLDDMVTRVADNVLAEGKFPMFNIKTGEELEGSAGILLPSGVNPEMHHCGLYIKEGVETPGKNDVKVCSFASPGEPSLPAYLVYRTQISMHIPHENL